MIFETTYWDLSEENELWMLALNVSNGQTVRNLIMLEIFVLVNIIKKMGSWCLGVGNFQGSKKEELLPLRS